MIDDVPNLVILGGALEAVAHECECLRHQDKDAYSRIGNDEVNRKIIEGDRWRYLSQEASSVLMDRLSGVVRLDQVDREVSDLILKLWHYFL